MDNFIIGEGLLGFNEIAREMKKSRSFEIFVQNWRSFGESLGVSDVKMLDIEGMLYNRTMQHERIPREILKIWKAEKGRSATLKILHDALEECGVHDIAAMLSAKFLTPESVKMLQFIWHGKIVSLDQLVRANTSEEFYQKIVENVKNSYPSSPFELLKKELMPPEIPKYYIPRTLIYYPSVELDPRIFTSETSKNHVFLFKGLDKPELARCMNYEQVIELSGDQLDNVTAPFIVLECDDDFDRICTHATEPVHVIQYDGVRNSHSWTWIKSNGGLDLIRKFLKYQKTTIDEKKFLETIMAILSPPIVFSIADSPGMGKTLVLANLATQIQDNCAGNAILLFINLQEFFKQINLEDLESSVSAIEAIVSYSVSSTIPELVLTEMFSNEVRPLYLFLDGYDEVMQDKLVLVDSVLKQLQELKNIIIVMTTRPHLTTRLENIFNQFSYQIQPFNITNQVDFLKKYWIEQHGAKEGNALGKFAELCLYTLQVKLTDEEKEIAGIPLQCMLLGEVYAKDAKRASTLEATLREDIVQPTSLFEMYEKLMEIKFARIREARFRQVYQKAHAREAMALLFPEWVETFKPLLHGREEIDEGMMYSVGLLERNPNSTKFLHRTFAEYLVAEFIVTNLADDNECVNLLFGEILGRKGIEEKAFKDPVKYGYELKYQVIAYFIEILLKKKSTEQNSIDEILWPHHSTFKKFNSEDICVTVVACCSQDFENIFVYSSKMLHQYKISVDLRDKYFRASPHVVLWRSKNVKMLEKMLMFTSLEFNLTLRYHIIEKYVLGWGSEIPIFTSLHVAVMMGNYNAVAYLAHQYQEETMELGKLLLTCVCESGKDGRTIIEEKLLIIDKLVSLNRTWLEETDDYDCTPLLQSNVHLCLLQRLVEHGADINAFSSDFGTVLHTSRDKKTYLDHARWALYNGFNLVNRAEGTEFPLCGKTSLMHAIGLGCSSEEDLELLKLFHEAGADFNAVDKNQNSVLLYALMCSKGLEFIQKLLQYGSNTHQTNTLKQNCLHVLLDGATSVDDRLLIIDLLVEINRDLIEGRDYMECTPLLQENVHFCLLQRLVEHGADINTYSSCVGTVLHSVWNIDTYTELVEWAISKGFNLINRKHDGITPLMYAVNRFGSQIDPEVLSLFQKAGADFNAQDDDKNSVLFYARRNFLLRYDFIRKFMKYGAVANHVNATNKNPHVFVAGRSKSIKNAVSTSGMLDHINPDLLEKKDADGYPPLVRQHAYIDLLKRLVEHGSSINAISNTGCTLLHLSECKSNLAQWALTNGFKLINQKGGSDGITPLMKAIKNNGSVDDDTLKLLVDAGADLNAYDRNGNSVLFYALDNGNLQPDFVRKLLEYNVNLKHVNNAKQNALMKVVNGRGHSECEKRKLAIVDMLVKINPGFLDGRDELDCTALLQRGCTLDMMQLLVKLGADINAYSSHYGTILHFNRKKINKNTYPKLVTWAFTSGFELVNHTDRFNRTALLHALKVIGSVGDEVRRHFDRAGQKTNMEILKVSSNK